MNQFTLTERKRCLLGLHRLEPRRNFIVRSFAVLIVLVKSAVQLCYCMGEHSAGRSNLFS